MRLYNRVLFKMINEHDIKKKMFYCHVLTYLRGKTFR